MWGRFQFGHACDDAVATYGYLPAMTQVRPIANAAPRESHGWRVCRAKAVLVPDQLTKMGEGKQRNCAALYLLREIRPALCARYVKQPSVALHSGHTAS